jgi:hypothetical protein
VKVYINNNKSGRPIEVDLESLDPSVDSWWFGYSAEDSLISEKLPAYRSKEELIVRMSKESIYYSGNGEPTIINVYNMGLGGGWQASPPINFDPFWAHLVREALGLDIKDEYEEISDESPFS